MFHDLLRATLLAALLLSGSARAWAEEQPPDPAVIPALIEQLGHPRFSIREQAMDRLQRFSSLAIPLLEACGTHPDREIRYRAARLVAVIRKQDFERRLAAFRAETNESEGHGLPGWERFFKLVGASPEARALFVEMQRAEGKLLARGDDPKVLTEAVSQRATEIQATLQVAPQQIGLGTAASLLFAATSAGVDPTDQADSLIYSLCYQPAFSQAVRQEGPQRDVLRKLLGGWIVKSDGATTLYRSVSLALQHDLREGLVPAERILKQEGGVGTARHYAVLAVLRFGGVAQRPLLEQALADTTICSQQMIGQDRYVAQLGDVALAGLIHQAKQNPRDFGFARAEPHPMYVYNVSTLGFKNDEERTAARAKWQAFCKVQEGGTKETAK